MITLEVLKKARDMYAGTTDPGEASFAVNSRGLCNVITEIILGEESDNQLLYRAMITRATAWFRKIVQSKRHFVFYWPPGEKEPRLKWLEDVIARIEAGENLLEDV